MNKRIFFIFLIFYFILHNFSLDAQPLTLHSVTMEYDYKDTTTNRLIIYFAVIEYDYIKYVDTTPPSIPILSLEPDYTPGTINTISWSESTDDATGIYGYFAECSTDETFSTIFSSSGWITITSYTFTNLSDGVTYFYRVKARDNAGNESGWSNVVWSVQDNTAPNMVIISPIGTIPAGANTITVQSTKEPLPSTPTVKITLNGASTEDITLLLSTTDDGYTWSGSYTIPTANKGEGYLEVRAVDRVGYLGYSSGTFIVESGAVLGIEVFNLFDAPDPFKPDEISTATFYYTADRQNIQYTIQWSSLTLLDPFGNFVQEFTRGIPPAYPTTYTEIWDGKNLAGNIVSDGIYTYRVTAGGIRQWGNPNNPNIESVEATPKTATITVLKRINFTIAPGTTFTNPSNPTFVITPMTSSETARVFGISPATADRIIGSAYRIEPTGVILSPSATLTLYYDEPLPPGISETDLRIYRFEPGQAPIIMSSAGDIDTTNNLITIQISELSTFAILSPGAVFIPPEEIDTIPPTFTVHLTFNPEKTDEITLTITASEKLITSPGVTVYPHGESKNKLPVNVEVTLLEGTEMTYTGKFTRVTGFGDIGKVIVIGKDLAGNEGISDGTYTKNVISSSGGIVKDPHSDNITLIVSSGIFNSDKEVIVTIKPKDETDSQHTLRNSKAKEKNLKLIGKAYELSPSGIKFNKPVTISIRYDDKNITDIDESILKIAYWDEAGQEWYIIDNSKVDKQNKQVYAEITHFSIYQIVAPTAIQCIEIDSTFKLGEVYAFPNPAKGTINPTIHIEVGIADSVEVRIYNIAAELVDSVELAGNNYKVVDNKYAYEYEWDTSEVASGVYIYYVKAEKQGYSPIKVIKKLAVIK